MRTFVLTRHGESRLNVQGVVNGDPGRDLGLTSHGEDEARDLGGQLAGLTIDLVVTSRFPRARETAQIALAGRDIRQLVDPDLDDVRVGELEGQTIADYRAWKRGRLRSEPFPGGESLDDAAERYARAFAARLEGPELCVLVVCHEIPVRYAVNATAGSETLDAPLHDVGNATPYIFDEHGLAAAINGLRASRLS